MLKWRIIHFAQYNQIVAIVPIKDDRLTKLNSLVNVPNTIYATLEFVDIAGLVKGASQGEGLGNQFLSHVRNTDALIHVVRIFDDPNVIHVSGEINPIEDIEIINLELALCGYSSTRPKNKKIRERYKR